MEGREAKQAEAVRLRRQGLSYRQIAARLGVSHQTVALWVSSAREAFFEDLKEKQKARPKGAVGKKRPKKLLTPSDFEETVPWWQVAPPIIHVLVSTGQVLVFNWPLER